MTFSAIVSIWNYRIKANIFFLVVIALISCQKEKINTPPSGVLTVFPYAGDTTTIFTFDASKSKDAEDVNEKLSVRWDWNSDGVCDTDANPELKALHRFSKKGMIYIRMEIFDSGGMSVILNDSVRVFPIPVKGSMTDPRDGQKYETVYLEGNWWMAESLRYGTVIPSDSLQKDNGIAETYAYRDDLKNLDEFGGLYSWFEAMQYVDGEKGQGICPPGWHVPSFEEWSMIAPFSLPYLFLYYYYGPGGPGGLNLKYGGYYTFIWETRALEKYGRYFSEQSYRGSYWTSTNQEEKWQDFVGNIAYQRWNIGISIDNVLNDSTTYTFDNLGMIPDGDRIHLRGKVIAYDKYAGDHPTNARYAYSVRCAKDL
jgi:hypothetical protein